MQTILDVFWMPRALDAACLDVACFGRRVLGCYDMDPNEIVLFFHNSYNNLFKKQVFCVCNVVMFQDAIFFTMATLFLSILLHRKQLIKTIAPFLRRIYSVQF